MQVGDENHVPCTDLAALKIDMKGKLLPNGWTESETAFVDELVYTKVSIHPHAEYFVVNVNKELKWSLSCHGTIVEVENCSVLRETPTRLTSASELVNLLSTLQSAQICLGNPIADFRPLLNVRGDAFKDATGVHAWHNKYSTELY